MLFKSITSYKYINNYFNLKTYQLVSFFHFYKLKLPLSFRNNRSYFRFYTDVNLRLLTQTLTKRGSTDFYRNHLIRVINVINLKLKTSKLYTNSLFYLSISTITFFQIIYNFNIYFKFSFHLIDKNIRKFSRGKSGKYKIVFNYIPKFKRNK